MSLLPVSATSLLTKATCLLQKRLKENNFEINNTASIISRFIFYPISLSIITPLTIFYNTTGMAYNGLKFLLPRRILRIFTEKDNNYHLELVNAHIAYSVKDCVFDIFFSRSFWLLYTFSPNIADKCISIIDSALFSIVAHDKEPEKPSININLVQNNVQNNIQNNVQNNNFTQNQTIFIVDHSYKSRISISSKELKFILQLTSNELIQYLEDKDRFFVMEIFIRLTDREKEGFLLKLPQDEKNFIMDQFTCQANQKAIEKISTLTK